MINLQSKTILFCALISSFLLLNSACKNEINKPANDGLLPVSSIDNPRSANETEDLSKLGTLTFTDSVHDFGKIKEGEVVNYDFEYTNTGKSDILINDAKSTCGCTVPKFKTDPIAPGEKGSIEVKFNSEGKHDMVEKTVTVFTNGNPGEINIKISAEVTK